MLYADSLSIMNVQLILSSIACVLRSALYGSTIPAASFGDGQMTKSIIVFFAYMSRSFSMSADVKPLPVPPPTEW